MPCTRLLSVDLAGSSIPGLPGQFQQGLKFLHLALRHLTGLSEPFRCLDPGDAEVTVEQMPARLLDWGMDARRVLYGSQIRVTFGYDGQADWVRLESPMPNPKKYSKRCCVFLFSVRDSLPYMARLHTLGLPEDLQTLTFWTSWYPTFSGGSRVGHGPSLTLQQAIDGSENQHDDS